MRRIAFALAAMLIPASVGAQSVPINDGLNLRALPTAFVLDDRGVETSGKLLRLDDAEVVLLIGNQQRHFDTQNIARVTRRGDSLKNGATAGLVVGLVLNALALAQSDWPRDSGWFLTFAALNTALYTAIGTAIDAAVPGRTTLYQAPSTRRPGASTRHASIGLRFKW